MKGDNLLKRPQQFDRVFKSGSSAADRFLVFKAAPNRLESSRYGISVGRKVGNAVVRNRVKRRLREILRLESLSGGWDFIVIARKTSAEGEYRELRNSARALLSRLEILK